MANPTCKQRGLIALAGTSEPEPAIRSRPNEPDAGFARTNPSRRETAVPERTRREFCTNEPKPARKRPRPNEPELASSALPQPPCSACRSSSRAMMLRWIWFVPS